MNTLSKIINTNYNEIREAKDQALNQIEEKVLDTKSVEPQNASQIFADYKETKTELYKKLNEDIKHFNENVEPKPLSVYNLKAGTKIAIRKYRSSGNRTLLDNLSNTLENAKDVKRNKFLLKDDLTRDKTRSWVNGILGAGLGVGASYLLGESGNEISLYLASGFSGGFLSGLITATIGMYKENQVNKTLQEADTLSKQLTELKVEQKIETKY